MSNTNLIFYYILFCYTLTEWASFVLHQTSVLPLLRASVSDHKADWKQPLLMVRVCFIGLVKSQITQTPILEKK